MRSKTIDKFYPEEKVSKKCFINRTKKPVDRSKPILKRNKKFFYQTRTKPRSMLPFQEAMGETSHKQQNLILTSFQFRKIINIAITSR